MKHSYNLTNKTIENLKLCIKPTYNTFFGKNIVVNHNVSSDTLQLHKNDRLLVAGYKDNGDGIQVLIVSINGSTKSSNCGFHYIIWSLDTDKYTEDDVREYVNDTGNFYRYTMILPKRIEMVSDE